MRCTMSVLKNGDICPVCEKGKLKEIRKDLILSYKNSSKKFENENVFECDVCDYEALPKESNKRVVKELTDFRRNINGLLMSDQLKSIRKSLGLNIKQMAKLLSVNDKTVGRYENGKVTQSAHIDKLYRILQVFPSVASILRPDIGVPISSFKGHVILSEHVTLRENDNYIPEPVSTYNFIADDYFDLKGSKNATGC